MRQGTLFTKGTASIRVVAIVFAAALLAGSCGSDSTEVLGATAENTSLSEITFGGQYYPGDFVLKGDPGLWGASNVEHILFSSGTENNQALIAGDIDINVGSDSKSASLFDAIPDEAVIIAIMQRGDRYSTIVQSGGGFDDWESLKGETVATRLGSGAEQVLRRYFDETDGLAWEDFEWVNLKVEEMAPALQNGSIVAFTAWEPTPAIAEAQGVGDVMRSYGDVAQVPVAMHTTRAYAEDHRAEIVQFLAAHVAKVELIEVDFSLSIDDDALASIDNTVAFLYDQGKINTQPTIRSDPSFLEEARKLAN